MYDAPLETTRTGQLTDLGDGEFELRFERRLKHPLDKVWNAISIPERIADWFCEMTFQPEPGQPITHVFHHMGKATGSGEVLRFEAPHLFEWRWHGPQGDPGSVVTWRLEADGADATRLTLTHRTAKRHKIHEYGYGWHVHLDGLGLTLDGGRFSYPPADHEAVMAHYNQAFG